MTLYEIDLATAASYQLVGTDSGTFAWCRQVHPSGTLPMLFGARDARAMLEGIERHEREYHPVPYVPAPWRNPHFYWGAYPNLGAAAPHHGPRQLRTAVSPGDLVAIDVNHYAITRMEDLTDAHGTLTRWVTVRATEDWPTRSEPYVVIPFLGYPADLHPDPRKRRAMQMLKDQRTAEHPVTTAEHKPTWQEA